MNRIVALLPMKGNSERVKGKNFRDFSGRPLFKWVLDTLLSLESIDLIVINTDAREVLAGHGLLSDDRILIRDRPAEICGDLVSMNKVIADDIEHVSADLYLMTHTTNPFLSAATIEGAIRLYMEKSAAGEADSLFTVNKVQTRFYSRNGDAINHDPKNLVRTQDLEPWYEENSNLYLFTAQSFRNSGARIGRKPVMYESPRYESIDIDTPSDWEFGAAMAQYYLIAKGEE